MTGTPPTPFGRWTRGPLCARFGSIARLLQRALLRHSRVPTVLALVALLLAACGGAAAPATGPSPSALAGRYRVSSGGGALALVQALTKAYSERHPSVLWDIENVGSDAAIASVQAGEADLGAISRELQPAEVAKVATVSLGAAGTAVGVNAANPITELTKDQIRAIFSGSIKDWSAVGGAPGAVKAFVREPTAATREVFDQFVFDGKPTYRADNIPVDSNAQTLNALYSFKDAIGMLTLNDASLSDSKIRLLAIDGVAPTLDNVKNGTYKMRRALYLVHGVDPRRVKPAIADFVAFVNGPDGQRIIGGK
jgi:phosphate transport system substrate-binding protein